MGFLCPVWIVGMVLPRFSLSVRGREKTKEGNMDDGDDD